MTIPDPDEHSLEVPKAVRVAARDDSITPVWLNEAGGVTFRLGDGPGRRFAKWAPHGSGLDLHAEELRLRWAAEFTPVPRVLEIGSDDDGDYLLTAGLPGRSAVDARWVAAPEAAVRAAGRGLRLLHDALPVDECPFGWSVEERIATSATARTAPPRLGDPPPDDLVVVCHGDACVPNTPCTTTARGRGTSTSTPSAWPTAGPTCRRHHEPRVELRPRLRADLPRRLRHRRRPRQARLLPRALERPLIGGISRGGAD
nr:hypothetical protein GCM10025699_77040 [Microbacterium flavescens]